MENKLNILFDFQRFEENSRLAQIIAETDKLYGNIPIDDEDLSFVSAAGELAAIRHREDMSDDDT